jgi:hypothetical protein
MSIKYKKNPNVPHWQADLFEGKDTNVGRFIPLDDLTEAQITALPREAFSQEEFDSIDGGVQEEIHTFDPKSRKRIEEMVSAVNMRLHWIESDETDMAEEDFGDALHNTDGQKILEGVPDHDDVIDELYQTYGGVIPKDRIQEALLEHLTDADYYDQETEDANASGAYPFKINIEREFFITVDDIDGLEGAYPDEIGAAISKLEEGEYSYVMGEAGIDAKMLIKLKGEKYGELRISLDPSYALVFTPKWEQIKTWVDEMLSEEMPDEALPTNDKRSLSERKIYTFEDGAYWVELTTEDLPEESETLGHCVGQFEHGYPQAVQREEMKIFSLRTPGGRSKLTAAFNLDSEGDVESVDEISGKGNRRPGWAAGKTGDGKVKWMEVQKVGKLLELMGFSEDGMRDLPALRTAHDAMHALYEETGKVVPLTQNPDISEHCSFCQKEQRVLRKNPKGFKEPWWERDYPSKEKPSYKLKRDALNVFVAYNQEVIDRVFDGMSRGVPDSYDNFNREFDLEENKKISTFGEALWLALDTGRPYRIENINIDMLNDTPIMLANSEGMEQLRMPDFIEEARLSKEQAEYWKQQEEQEDKVPF